MTLPIYLTHRNAKVLEPARLESISSLTLFHKDHSEGGISTIATTLKVVRRMRGLKKFHLLLEHHLITRRWWSTSLHERCVTKIKRIQVLFALRGIIDIKVRDLDLEERAHKAGDPAKHTHSDAKEVINGQVEVLKHFNYGLALAQKGLVVDELCWEFWWRRDEWPALGGETCNRTVGCLCGNCLSQIDEV